MSDKKRILIVEDEKPMAHALELKLAHEGFDVVCALNGESAFEILEKEHFDVILCDLIMPRMDGFQFLEKAKEKNVTASIIMLTNLSQAEDEKKARSLGAKGFYVKSNTPITEVVEHIRSFLG